jgi:hypothetical protein
MEVKIGRGGVVTVRHIMNIASVDLDSQAAKVFFVMML